MVVGQGAFNIDFDVAQTELGFSEHAAARLLRRVLITENSYQLVWRGNDETDVQHAHAHAVGGQTDIFECAAAQQVSKN